MASTLSNVWYDVGDRVKLSVAIRDLESVETPLIDPDVLVFAMLEPEGSLTTYTYGVDAQVVKDGTGLYHVKWDTVAPGLHWSRFQASGNVGAAEELGFRVKAPKVAL